MKKLGLFLAAAGILAAQSYVSPVTSFEDASYITHSSFNLTPALNVSAGALIACFVRYNGSTGSVSVTGNGDTFTNVPPYVAVGPPAASDFSALFFRQNATASSSYAVTVSIAGSGAYVAAICAQYSGAATSGGYDVAASGSEYQSGGGAYPYNYCTTGNFTTTQAKELIVTGVTLAGTGITSGYAIRGSTPNYVSIGDSIVTAIQTGASVNWTGASYSNWGCNLATFRAVSAAGVSQPFIF